MAAANWNHEKSDIVVSQVIRSIILGCFLIFSVPAHSDTPVPPTIVSLDFFEIEPCGNALCTLGPYYLETYTFPTQTPNNNFETWCPEAGWGQIGWPTGAYSPICMNGAYPVTGYTSSEYTCPGGKYLNPVDLQCHDKPVDAHKNTGFCLPCALKQLFGDPINSGTGNSLQHENDYIGQGVFPLVAVRTYNSDASEVGSGPWGGQWRGHYDRTVTSGTSGAGTPTTATVQRGDGRAFTFNPGLVVGDQAMMLTRPTQLSTYGWIRDPDVVGKLVMSGQDSNNVPTAWTYVNEQDETERYNASGQLVSITNLAGQVQTLTYSDGTTGANGGYILDANGNATTTTLPAGKLIRVTDPAGRTLQYGYDANGHVVKMTDPAGGVYHYAYDASNNLTGITYPDGKTRTYLYGEAANVSGTPNAGVTYTHSLTGIVDQNGNRYATWTFDAAGRAASSELGASGSGINKVSLAYAAPDANGNSTTSVTDVRGVARTYSFSNVVGMVKTTGITGQPCDGCFSAYGFDGNGNVAFRSDFNGNTTCYAYDQTRNLETVRLEGLAPATGTTPTACPANLSTYAPSTTAGSVERKITTQWHATWRLPVTIAEPLRITTYTYDAQGNVLTKTIQPTADATGAAGVTAAPAGTARTWTYTYNAAGQVLTVDGPRTDVADITTYTYDTQGNLTSVKNALNQTSTLGGYDAHGHAGTITDPNGLATSLTWDVRGRLTARSRGGEVTSYTYDGVGNLTNVSLPSGASYTYTYDAAHRLTQITDLQGNYIAYTLDTAGNRTAEKVYNSTGTVVQTHSRVFDSLNHLVQDIGAVNQTTVYTYDANGNLQTVADPLNHQTVNAYDALNRLSQVTNPDTGTIKYGYDGEDQLTQVTDPRNLVTSYTRDGLGNLTQQQSPDTGATGLTYDAAGNLLTRTDAKGQVATYSYDALNRVTAIAYTGGTAPALNVSYQYDTGVNGIGHLTGITDATGTTSYSYDQHGRLASETANAYGAVYTTGYGYDAQGRLTGITYPSGRTINYTFDGQSRINSVSTTLNGTTNVLASNITYEPFGGVHSFTYGDGTTTPVQTYTRNRDQDGRIANYTLNGGRTMSLLYDAASQITTVSDSTNVTNPASYAYDPMSRLTGYIQGATSQGYGYDVDGNRTSQTIGATTTSYTLGATSNWLTATQTGAAPAQAVAHDANGATTADASKNNQYAYDLRGRLIQTTTAQGVINYEINALGLRVRKQVPYANTDTLFHYDAAGHLIAENPNGTAQYTREYIWLGDMPVAVMK